MPQYAFPYEKVEKDCKLVIYGAGQVGIEFLETINKTGYCEIVCILDKTFEDNPDFDRKFFPPKHIMSLNHNEYDTILVTISDKHAAEIMKANLLSYGVPEEKILIYSTAYVINMETDKSNLACFDNGGDVVKVALKAPSSFGAVILFSFTAVEFRKLAQNNLVLDVFSSFPLITKHFSFFDNCFPLRSLCDDNDYDAVILLNSFTILEKLRPGKVKRIAPRLADYFDSVVSFMDRYFPYKHASMCYHLNHYLYLSGTHKIEQHDVGKTFSFNRFTVPFFAFDEVGYRILAKYEFVHKKYLTLCTDCNIIAHYFPKLWPPEYFNHLISNIHRRYPDLYIVLVGSMIFEEDISPMKGVVDLRGKTNLSEISVLLKHSLLHIGTEGGLVHLNHSLSGNSCCLFGPTLPELYAYDENINLRSEAACANGCEHAFSNSFGWRCMYDDEYSPCMTSLTPEVVFDKVSGFIDSYRSFEYNKEHDIDLCNLHTIFSSGYRCALVGRDGADEVLQLVDLIESLTVFDPDLSDEPINANAPINRNYDKKLKELGATVEYGTLHNVPSVSDAFDVVISFIQSGTAYPEYALLELLRITKPGGIVAASISSKALTLYRKL
ncbi:MAG: hypothetical protein FWB97_03875 [Oscillospiraceae bacterium]|nr:hypothetical protein [Oscillospiraceae bacterium]